MKLPLSLLLLGAVLVISHAQSDAGSATEGGEKADQDVLADARAAKQDMCSSKGEEMTEELRAERRETIKKAAGDTNFVYEALTAENDQASEAVMNEELAPAKVLNKTAPVLLAVLMAAIYFLCCWTACPFCKCCRIGSGSQRLTPFLVRAGITVFLAVILLVCIIFGSFAIQGHKTGMEGVYTTSCEAADVLITVLDGSQQASPEQLQAEGEALCQGGSDATKTKAGCESLGCCRWNPLNTTTDGGNCFYGSYEGSSESAPCSGSTEAHFIGFNPLLGKVDELKLNLESGSGFMTDITRIIDSTQEISNAVAYASGRLELLKMVMEDPFNKQPFVTAEGDGHHTCAICDELPKILAPAVEALGGSLGQALADAREQVDKQLQGPTRDELRAQLDQATGPIKEMKKGVKESVGFMVDEENYKPVVSAMNDLLGMLVILVALLFIVVSGCGVVAGGHWTFRGERANQVGTANPYYKGTHRLACCTWCSAFFMVIFVLLVGGIFVLLVYVMSNLCVVLDEVDEPMLKKIMIKGDEGANADTESAVQIIDKCFLQTSTTPVNILELVQVDTGNGTKITFQEKFDSEVKGQIDSKFDSVAAKMSTGNTTIADNEQFNKLLAIIRNNPLDSMYFVDDTLMQDGLYSGMATDTGLSDLAVTTGLRCASHDISDDFDPPLAGTTVTGISDVDTKMATMGTPSIPMHACGALVACASSTDTACSAGNNYLKLKNDLRNKQYKCGFFESPSNDPSRLYCDPYDEANPEDCLWPMPDGSYALKPILVDCSWDVFVGHYAAFEPRLKADLVRIDDTSVTVQSQITVDLKTTVIEYLLTPIDVIVSKVTCNFLSSAYQGVVDGFCFQGVIGLRMIGASALICGIAGILLIILTYGVWRRTIDNVNAFEKAKAEFDATPPSSA